MIANNDMENKTELTQTHACVDLVIVKLFDDLSLYTHVVSSAFKAHVVSIRSFEHT